MYRQIPNQLTVCRLILAGLFFMVLGFYRFPIGPDWILLLATALFIVAVFTDWLDGYLARRWQAESTFGRIMDPFCDKVLILGAFIYLSGPRFVDKTAPDVGVFNIIPGNMSSGVYPWMVALMLAREMLVTSIRGELEESGVKFGANHFGKVKMVLQSVSIPLILVIVWWVDPDRNPPAWLPWARDTLVYATVAVTALSGMPYIQSAMRAIRPRKDEISHR